MISILFINGDPAHQMLAKIYLERSGGAAVTTAGRAGEALALLKAQAFDAVVTDYFLPDVDGAAFIAGIRSRWERLPVIVFSVWDRHEIGEEASAAGADALVHIGGMPIPLYQGLLAEIRAQVRRSTAGHL
ncbi:response regulator [Methanoculleus caldifontis]|nr:response regulator [Methanoculleus sp. Wushi-C6]